MYSHSFVTVAFSSINLLIKDFFTQPAHYLALQGEFEALNSDN